MLKNKIIYVILIVWISNCATAQNYPLKDTAFISALSSISTKLVSNDSLVILEAQKYTSNLYLAKKEIWNLDGIQYFIHTEYIDVSFNKLVTIPDLSQIVSLKEILMIGNKIKELPKLPKQIKTIFAFSNQISGTPYLENMDSLEYLHISKNQLKEIPDLENFPNLKKLHLNENQLTEIKGLEKAIKLKDLYAWANQISSFDGLSNNTTLEKIEINDNLLYSLPNFSNKPNLKYARMYKNYLTFEDLMPLIAIPLYDSIFKISPMYSPLVEVARKINLYYNHTTTVSTVVDTVVSNLNYSLFKNDSLLVLTNATGSFEITPELYSSNDALSISISSPAFKDFSLIDREWILNKVNCELLMPQYMSINKNECNLGADIQFIGSVYDKNYPYELTSVHHSYIVDSGLILRNIPQGDYVLNVQIGNQCVESKSFEIPNPSNCQEAFSPNGDGVKDTYYFDEEAAIEIYNLEGVLVKKMQGPSIWEGKDTKGEVLPSGYYTIIFDKIDVKHLTILN